MPPLPFETMLSKIEENAKIAIDELLEHRDIRTRPRTDVLLAWHRALRITCGKASRAEQQEMLTDLYRLQYPRS